MSNDDIDPSAVCGCTRRQFLKAVAVALALPAADASRLMLPTTALAATGNDLWSAYSSSPNTHPNLPNNSYAGYRRGETSPPVLPVAVSVTDFGAKGDGSFDNTSAFAQAIAAAGAKGGGAVLIPAGNFKLDGMIRLNQSGVVLRGAGRSLTTLTFTRNLTDVVGARFDPGTTNTQWSFTGGLVWIAPKDMFNASGKLLNYNNTVASDTTDSYEWEQWRGGSNKTGTRLAKITADARRGDIIVTVDSVAQLQEGQHVLMTWKNATDFSLLKHIAGHPRMDSWNWSGSTKILAGDVPRYRWPVQIKRIAGNSVTLAQPLRLDVRAAANQWDVDLQAIGPFVQECGIEELTIKLTGATNTVHLKHKGSNGIYFARAINCWARNVTIAGGENGLFFAQAKQISASGITITSPIKMHHPIAIRYMTADVLIEQFSITPQAIHGLNHENFTSGLVWNNGSMTHGTFDSHRALPFDAVRTQITLNNNTGASGGASAAGPRNGRRIVHWNVHNQSSRAEFVNEPDALSMGALVGMRGPKKTSCAAAMVCGDKGTLLADEGVTPSIVNLYAKQLELRRAAESWVHITNLFWGQKLPVGNITIAAGAHVKSGRSHDRVEFFVDGALVGQDTTSPYALTRAFAAGTYRLQVKFIDTTGEATWSTPIVITVQ